VHKQAPKKKKTSSKTDKALGGKKKGLQRSKSFNSTSSAAFTLYQDSSTNENFDDDGYEMVEEVDVGPRKAGKRRASRKQRPALGELINAVNQGSGDFHEVQRATTSHGGGGRARAQAKATSRAHTQGAHATNTTNVPPLAPLKGVLKRTLSAGDMPKPVGGRLTLEVRLRVCLHAWHDTRQLALIGPVLTPLSPFFSIFLFLLHLGV
jgi:hypothetical protein